MAAPDIMKAWDRLVSVATLGTRRAPVNEAELWPHADLAGAGEGASTELKVLRAAAAQRLFDVAGKRIAAQPAQEPTEIEVDRSRFVSEAAALRLLRMVKGEHPSLVAEWSMLAISARRQLPPHFVPLALTALEPMDGVSFGDLLGPTGQWLATMNPEWKFAYTVAAPSRERWLSGAFAERRAELSAVRKLDPQQAREWLQETWVADPPDQREAFVRLLATNLSIADEPFLEAALDDKRKQVRLAAVQLLASLADSQLSRRHAARLDTLIGAEQKSGFLAKLTKPALRLAVTLPETIDKAAQRDGIEAKPPAHRKIGERTFWLAQIVALTPPQYWTARLECDAATFIAAVQDTDYAAELLPALTEAAARHPERAWLHALSEAWRGSKENQIGAAQAIAELIAHAPHDLREELLVAQLSTLDSLRDQQMIHSILQTAQFAYSAQFTRLAIAHVSTLALRQPSPYTQNRNLFDGVGYHCDVPTASALLPKVLDDVPVGSNWRNALEHLNDIVEFRAAMRREIL